MMSLYDENKSLLTIKSNIRRMKCVYKTETFHRIAEYQEWLENIQEEISIEIISVVEFSTLLLVTYKPI